MNSASVLARRVFPVPEGLSGKEEHNVSISPRQMGRTTARGWVLPAKQERSDRSVLVPESRSVESDSLRNSLDSLRLADDGLGEELLHSKELLLLGLHEPASGDPGPSCNDYKERKSQMRRRRERRENKMISQRKQ
jgi:hypothetical protein